LAGAHIAGIWLPDARASIPGQGICRPKFHGIDLRVNHGIARGAYFLNRMPLGTVSGWQIESRRRRREPSSGSRQWRPGITRNRGRQRRLLDSPTRIWRLDRRKENKTEKYD